MRSMVEGTFARRMASANFETFTRKAKPPAPETIETIHPTPRHRAGTIAFYPGTLPNVDE
jgi:hypothetical protein